MNKRLMVMLAGAFMVPVLSLGLTLTSSLTANAAYKCKDGSSVADASKCNPPECDVTGGTAAGAGCAGQTGCLFGKDAKGNDCLFTTITNTLLFIIGAISVIMLIYGGIRYTISAGDSAAVTAAKNTILYAIVGLVVAILAYAIVNFVLTQFIKA